MRYFILDFESTDKVSTTADIIQASGFLVDEELNIKEVINDYILPSTPITKGAEEVHHISNEMIETLSDGYDIIDFVMDNRHILCDSDDICFITYNAQFDLTLLMNCYKRAVTRLVDEGASRSNFPKLNFGNEVRSLRGINNKTNGNCYFCLMKGCRDLFRFRNSRNQLSYRKLGYVLDEKTDYNPDSIIQWLKDFCNRHEIETRKELDFHNSLYDSFVSLLILTDYFPRFKTL